MEGEASNFDPNVNTQPFRGRKPDPTVAQLQARLLRSKTLRKDRYTVVINATEKVVKLVCLLCGLQLCVSNISTTQESHSGACALQRALDVGAPPPPNPAEILVPADVVDDVKKELALFFYTSGTAFARADNPHMKRALKLLGVDSPSAKQLRTTYLNNTHAVLQRRVATMMETLLMGLGLMMCTDGWRNKRAANGQPLVNLVLLKAEGGAFFHSVCHLHKGDRKDAQYYVDLHNEMANKVTDGRPHLLLGVIMDSPSTNRRALVLLEAQHQTWICMTCCVHALNLLCKDLANAGKQFTRHTLVGNILKQVQQISKTLHECDKIGNALDIAQVHKYGAKRPVATHIDTRFAILFTIRKDILRSKDALRMMVEEGDWNKVAASSTNAACFDVLKNVEWWKQLEAVIRLMQPISNAIHQLEADRPLLSQVMKVWSDLVSWAERWANDHGDPSGVNNVDPLFVLGVARLFKDRAKKHYQPVMAAARVLDPVNFIPTRPKAQPLPPMKDLTPEQQEDVVHVVARLAGVSQDVARHELRRFECGAWHHEMIRVANDIMSMSEPGQRNGRAVTIIAAASQRLTWWQIYAKPHFPALATAALRLLSVHVSTCASERNWSAWGRLFDDPRRSGLDMASAEKLIFIQTNDELAANYDSVDQSNQQDVAISLF